MNSWGYIAVGLTCSLIGGWFAVAVLGNGATILGTITGLLFLGAGAVLLPIGVIAEGVRIGSRESRVDADRESTFV